jgi:hypothetical protein
MEAVDIIAALTPIAVFGAVQLVKFVVGRVPGWIVVTFVVPVLSLAVAYVPGLIVEGIGFWQHFGLGLLAVFVNEFYRQLKQAVNEDE